MQDKIGWRHFTEGKMHDQSETYRNSTCSPVQHLTIDAWMRGLIRKLLDLTHPQWIFHNIIRHHHTNGTIKLSAKQDMMKEIKRQLNMGLYYLPPESKCLLEIDTSELLSSNVES